MNQPTIEEHIQAILDAELPHPDETEEGDHGLTASWHTSGGRLTSFNFSSGRYYAASTILGSRRRGDEMEGRTFADGVDFCRKYLAKP